jgi:hypothetical protein
MAMAATGALLLVGCGSTKAADGAIKDTFALGLTQIRTSQSDRTLQVKLARTIEQLRGERGSPGAMLAIRGFTWTLRGIEARLEITKNDSGNLPASVQDAKRSDRDLNRGVELLRAAGKDLGVQIGRIEGR